MKSKHLIISAWLMALPMAAVAQQHIQQAFDALCQSSKQKEVTNRQSINRNPDTGLMEGMSYVYDFEIDNASGRRLVTDIKEAFQKDEADSYSYNTGTNGGEGNYTALAVGDSNQGAVTIGLMKGSSYIYACFLDPLDSLRRYRYAYALEWVDKGGQIRGRLAKTYATTLKYRQAKAGTAGRATAGNVVSLFSLTDQQERTSEMWLSEFNTYKTHFLRNPGGAAATSFATQIYKLCKDSKPLEDVEKNLVATEIDRIKTKTKDEFVRQLFDMSIERLKK